MKYLAKGERDEDASGRATGQKADRARVERRGTMITLTPFASVSALSRSVAGIVRQDERAGLFPQKEK